MYEDLIADREELRRLKIETDVVSKDVDFSNMDDIARYEIATAPYYEKLRAFESKYGVLLSKFNSDLVDRLRQRVENGRRLSKVLCDEDLSLDGGSLKLTYKVVVEHGVERVVGGEISCLDRAGVFENRIREDEIAAELFRGLQFCPRCSYILNEDEPLRASIIEYLTEEWSSVHLLR